MSIEKKAAQTDKVVGKKPPKVVEKKLIMKLLIDHKSHKVLFAEAGKEVVDFMFSLLGLPMGTVLKLLNKDLMVGSVESLYSSLERLNETYILSNDSRASLLNPSVSSTFHAHSSLLLGSSIVANKYYKCGSGKTPKCENCVTEGMGKLCPHCGKEMIVEMEFVGDKVQKSDAGGEERGMGYVKGVVTYTVNDDLSVTPMSAISSLAIVNKFLFKDGGPLDEKMVEIGFEEGLRLLKASLQSKTVLTDVFLGKKKEATVQKPNDPEPQQVSRPQSWRPGMLL